MQITSQNKPIVYPTTEGAVALLSILAKHTGNMDEIRLFSKAMHHYHHHKCYTPRDIIRFLDDNGYIAQILHQPTSIKDNDLVIHDMNSCHQDFTFYAVKDGIVHEYRPQSLVNKKKNKLWRTVPLVPKGSHYNVTILRHSVKELNRLDSQN